MLEKIPLCHYTTYKKKETILCVINKSKRGANKMGNCDAILTSNDVEKMEYYLEYVKILIVFFEKRDTIVKELYHEKEMLEKQLAKLK